MITAILKRDKRSSQDGGRGVAGCSLLAGGLSLGKGRDTVVFRPGGERLGSAPRSLAVGLELSCLGCCCGENSLSPRSSVLLCFLFNVDELLLTRATVEPGPFQHFQPHREGDPDPHPFLEGASPSRCFLLLLWAFSLHFNSTPCVHWDPPSASATAWVLALHPGFFLDIASVPF